MNTLGDATLLLTCKNRPVLWEGLARERQLPGNQGARRIRRAGEQQMACKPFAVTRALVLIGLHEAAPGMAIILHLEVEISTGRHSNSSRATTFQH